MNSKKYCKKIHVKPGEIYYKQSEDGTLTEVEPEIVYSDRFLSFRSSRFMKTYFVGDSHEKKIVEVNGELCKYFKALGMFSDGDNKIDMDRFNDFVGMLPSSFCKLKNKLEANGVIHRKEGEKSFFLNPIVGVKREKLDSELWERFRKKNKELYNITEI